MNNAYSVNYMDFINNVSGSQKHGKVTLDKIIGNGSVNLEGTCVNGSTIVNGSFYANEAILKNLQVNGSATMYNCHISGAVTVNGAICAEDSKFDLEVSVASQKVIFRKCILESLEIREIDSYNANQIIDLRSDTVVKGNIFVESGRGEIWISKSSDLTESQVVGAKIYKK